ncbi:MAG: DNA polymerase I [Spirochaetae bacterium HGW-Spirochaetae-1]|nr:MAG: DNA polymerase I [Spirochaetae bacterium HGW-Spirochaetae-1]
MKKRLFVIDGHALCYRAYFAFLKNPLTNSRGQNVSAIFGFARMLYKLMDEQKPDYIVVAFDPPKKSFRFGMYAEYKANREKMPDDLRSQIGEIKDMVAVMGIETLEHPDYEADDILGTIVEKYARGETEVVLVTGDKDAYQLVRENVLIYANKKGITEYEIYDEKAVEEKLGIRPGQVIDYMALTGDSSDNIPGVKGIGEKTALKLITEYGTLENIYAHIDDLKGKVKEQLVHDHDMAFLSRDLVTIRRDVEIPGELDSHALPDIRSDKAREYFGSMEMNGIIRDFFGSDEIKPAANATTGKKDYRIVRSEADLRDLVSAIEKAREVSVDTETTSISPVEAELVGMSFSVEERAGWYVPMQSRGLFSEEYPDPVLSIKLLKPLLEDETIKKIGQNIKYDLIVFRNNGIELKGVWFDTMVASYLLNPTERRHNLDDMAEHHLNYRTITFKELTGTGKNAVPVWEVPLDRLAEYAIEDADITYRLYKLFSGQLAEEKLESLFFDVEMKLVTILADMEQAGVKIDAEYFSGLARKNDAMLAEVEENIYHEAGQTFNINSTRELAAILFEKLGLKPVKKTKTGFSTDITVLESLRGHHAIVDNLIAYRTLSKLKSTYIDTLPKLINPKTGRIHTSYNQTVVATGRLSSSDPNLQNIPVRDDFGKNIRKGFTAEPGFVMLAADYSQIELRLAAHLSMDENMIRAFKEGIDIHSLTASSVFGCAIDAVTPDMRRKAKVVNFATIYGVSPYGLSQQAEIDFKEAAEFIRRYFETYPGFRKYMDDTIAFAREHGYVKTLLGRKRLIPDIGSDTVFRREGAERVAINTPIQGTSADMIKIAMINIAGEFNKKGLRSRMIMQVHDELVFEVHEDEKVEVESIVVDKMEHALDLQVPIVVDTGWGNNWEEAH